MDHLEQENRALAQELKLVKTQVLEGNYKVDNFDSVKKYGVAYIEECVCVCVFSDSAGWQGEGCAAEEAGGTPEHIVWSGGEGEACYAGVRQVHQGGVL